MRRLEPVIWTKGTFLNPQHLQLQDRFIEDSLRFHLQTLTFLPWGFRRLVIDQEALTAGSLALTEASGMMPDGLVFDIATCDPAPALKPLAPFFGPDDDELDVFLAIPNYREGGLNVALRAGADARYRSEIEMLRDENTGTAEKPVQVARKNFRLLTGRENRDGMSALRMARVRKKAAGAYELDPHFVPPLVQIGASEYLASIARRLVEILSSRSSALAGMRHQKNQTLADFTAADIPNFWLLYTINTWLPLFRHLFETGHAHPEVLFSNMLSMAGALTTFSTSIHARDLPAYDHEDLGACFTSLDEKLRVLLETVVPRNFVSLALKQVSPAIYATAIDDDRYLARTRLYLAISAETSQAELIAKVPHLVKICSASHIERLVRQALPGVPLTHVAVPPSAILVKMNYQYFSLGQSEAAWESVIRSRNLAAYVPSDFGNPQLELIVLLPQNV